MIAAGAVEIPIEWDNLTLSWNAVCAKCRECLFMLPHESGQQPDRSDVDHVCFGKWKVPTRG